MPFFYKLYNNTKQFLSIINVFFIFFTEYTYYLWSCDNFKFVHNVTHKLVHVNILYVKIFQALALNNDLIDKKYSDQLIQFTDNAPWINDDINWSLLNKVCKEYNITLEKPYPINSGMISLVFKGIKITENDNVENVAIKILRNNINDKLHYAINNLHYIIYLLSFLPVIHNFIDKYKIKDIVNTNIQIILQQTDFEKEVDNMNQFKTNCKHLKYIKIPYVYKEVTNQYPQIIIMEYIQGVKINQISIKDYQPFAKQIIKFGIVTSTIHGFVHGDLHSGNILFIKNNDSYIIGILDFGIVNEISSSFKNILFEIAGELFHASTKITADKLLHSGLIEPNNLSEILPLNDYNNILDLTAQIIEETIANSKNTNQLQLYKFVTKFNNYLSNNDIAKFGIKPSDSFVKAQLVVAMTQGIVLKLCKENIIELVDNVINELFHINIVYV